MEWISVKEKLPPRGVEILLYIPYPDHAPYVLIGNYGRWIDVVASFSSNPANHFSHSHVTHWMPLPEPPVQNQSQTESNSKTATVANEGE